MILITRDGERLVTALETIAKQMQHQDHERIAHLESLLRNFVRLMLDPKATDDQWASLLERVRETVT